jgi:hypothetical protein
LTAFAAAASSGTTTTAIPALRIRTAPPPGTKIGGSRHAITTRRMPLETMRSAHGTGREARAAHGSSELYSVEPASGPAPTPAVAALARATSSAWSAGSSSRENP